MAVQAMKAGAIDFLVKPFDDLIFLNAVQRAIAKSRQRRALTDGTGTKVR